ncbi:unnamed protein product [Camellia sinensis]
MKCRDRLHELIKEEIEKKDSSTKQWKIAMESSFNRMDNEVIFCELDQFLGYQTHQCSDSPAVREHAAAVLAGLMKGGDENLAEDFRGKAYRDANAIQKKRRQSFIHGAVLALAACVLSVSYDIPSCDQLEVLKLHLDHSGTQGHRRGSQSGGIEYAQSDVWASAYSALAAGAALIAGLSMLAY